MSPIKKIAIFWPLSMLADKLLDLIGKSSKVAVQIELRQFQGGLASELQFLDKQLGSLEAPLRQ